MTPSERDSRTPDQAAAAAAWVMRLDRGLSPAEQDEYLQWLAADPRHGAAMARQRQTWDAFDRLAGLQASVEAVPDPDLLEPERTGPPARPAPPAAGPAITAVVSVPAHRRRRWLRFALPAEPPPTLSTASISLAPIQERTLEDGTTVRLNRGTTITVDYSSAERRVRLERGEAAFAVAKDPARPFLVTAAGVGVRAVGTEFNVRHDPSAVDVIVTEGSVIVTRDGPAASADPAPVVAAGQRVVVPLAGPASFPPVSTPPPEEMARRLAWQPRLLTFSDESLAIIVNEFNRHNPVILQLADPSLQAVRLSARFRSDNVAGFLRLLESEFGLRAEVREPGAIRLRAER